MPVMASNRIGREVAPGGAVVEFCGSSFIAGHLGQNLGQASRDAEAVITATIDLDAVAGLRESQGIFRDRRPGLCSAMNGLAVNGLDDL